MTLPELLKTLAGSGLGLRRKDDDAIEVTGNVARLTADTKAALATHKAEILALLSESVPPMASDEEQTAVEWAEAIDPSKRDQFADQACREWDQLVGKNETVEALAKRIWGPGKPVPLGVIVREVFASVGIEAEVEEAVEAGDEESGITAEGIEGISAWPSCDPVPPEIERLRAKAAERLADDSVPMYGPPYRRRGKRNKPAVRVDRVTHARCEPGTCEWWAEPVQERTMDAPAAPGGKFIRVTCRKCGRFYGYGFRQSGMPGGPFDFSAFLEEAKRLREEVRS